MSTYEINSEFSLYSPDGTTEMPEVATRSYTISGTGKRRKCKTLPVTFLK